MRVWLFTFFIAVLFVSANPKAYEIVDREGKSRSYNKLLKAARAADVVLFGELHDDPIAHWLQLRLAKDLYQTDSLGFYLGAEMFERDQQLLLDEYINGQISTSSFESQARLWPNYDTDYKPLVDWARQHEAPFVATNIPRRYASVIAREGPVGLDSLSQEARRWTYQPPLEVDFGLSQYQKMMQMGGNMHGHGGGMKPENFVYAQAAKDKTMAESILRRWREGRRCLHLNGSFHSDYFQGIMHYLEKANPSLRIVTISTVRADDIEAPGQQVQGRATYTLVVDSDMIHTH